MAFEKRDLTGTLFKNDKMMNDKSPQYHPKQAAQGRTRIPSIASYRRGRQEHA